MRKIILNLGSGTLATGYRAVIGEIIDTRYPARFSGQLPAAPALADALRHWQQLYQARHQNLTFRIQLLQQEGICYSEHDFNQVCTRLVERFNEWLNTSYFLPIDRALRSELARSGNTQIVLEAQDLQLRKLPWHLWQLLSEYPQTELTFSNTDWSPLPAQPATSERARILATFGHHDSLNLKADLATLSNLPGAALSILEAPSLSQLHDQLWQPAGWDIFFYAGHSTTQGETGIIDLNEEERLTIAQIKHALSKAIDNGLKIAIFNSCDGLGLAQQLSDLQIPYIVVMREPVPDHVAQQFLEYLLTAFAAGQPFHLAVGEARQRLAGLENEVPCASWLPIIWQNPTAQAIYWRDLQSRSSGRRFLGRGRSPLLKSLVMGGIVLGLRALGLLEPLELLAYDHLMRSRPAEPVDARIVVVEASKETTSEYGYPIPDELLTTAIEQINQSEPLVVGIDLHRGRPRPAQPNIALQGSEASLVSSQGAASAQHISNGLAQSVEHAGYGKFLQQVEQSPNLFIVCAYSSTDENYQVPSQLSETSRLEQVGFSDLPIDTPLSGLGDGQGDGRTALLAEDATGLSGAVRRQLISYSPEVSATPSACTTPYSFSFQLAFQYLFEQGITPLTVTPDEHWRLGPVVLRSLPQRFGGYQGLDTLSSQVLLNYRTSQPAQKLSFEQLISGNFDPQMMRDRIVIVGYNSPVSKDYFSTPYGTMAGVWVHTHMVSQLVGSVLDERPLMRVLPQWGNWQWGDMLWIVAWSCLGGLGGWAVGGALMKLHRSNRVKVGLWLITAGGGVLLLYGICWVAIIAGLWLPFVPSAFAALGAGVVSTGTLKVGRAS